MKKNIVSLSLCTVALALTSFPIVYAAGATGVINDGGSLLSVFSVDIMVIIAILGFVLGILSFVLAFKNLKYNKGNLIVTNGYHSYYFDAKVFLDVGFRTDCAAAFTLNFDNRSHSPLVIESVYMKIGDKTLRHVPEFKVDEFVSHPSGNINPHRIALEAPGAKFPIRLAAFDTVSAGVRFPWFSDAVKSFGEPVDVKIFINTSKGVVKHRITLKEVDRYFARFNTTRPRNTRQYQ